jgi:acyl-CoA reductase-like NAD-dependent aldehyde dehydrogenase
MHTTAQAGTTIPVLDPATGERIGAISAGDEHVADAAVHAARAAQPGWARVPATDRAAFLKAGARRLRDSIDELAELQTREGGKPLAESRAGVVAGIEKIEQYAELGPLHRGRALVGEWDTTDLMVHEPRGVIALLVPWNDPLALASGQVAASVVTGNTVVLKPSEHTPLSTIRLVEVLDLPQGVLQLLLGDERAGRPLAAHPGVDMVIHTGSVDTGREIAITCAGQLRKVLLELGGKDPLIVDADVDPAWAAEQAADGAFANTGQVCTSVERIYVHHAVADRFAAALVERARAVRVGPGMKPGVEMGPLIDKRQRDVVHGHVADAVASGAQILTGGAPLEGPGWFYPPTVLAGCHDGMAIMREETFGPVAAMRVVRSFDEAIDAANGTAYALAATVLTGSQEHGQRAWRELIAGTVKVNSVWGSAPGGAAEPGPGSGMGSGYGPELLDEVTHAKVVHLEAAPAQAA